MGACNRNALLEAHQLGQHQGAGHYRNMPSARLQHLGVGGLHGGGSHHCVGTSHMVGMVADESAYAQRVQALQRGAVAQVGAADAVAQVVQDFGNT